ncbi:hypothetical protein BBAD15_g6464 [Beauveria bassiana D1-5]|uniref:Zn(2)-C6 fungal-type domain-containing protein n=1 Tax=Beauveria bassiana D1-5 TaxID=1245745 RepID=A0A0A2W5J5_BEABA|nr:hypothetical protein BBAD15_g6464 [Beauveria bassiana D1-5]
MSLVQSERKKAWAPRSRRGCYTCRSRRIKCDEHLPVCNKCLASDRACRYPALRLDRDEPRELPTLASKAALHQREPPDWNLAQGMLFFATVLVPMYERGQVATTSYRKQFPSQPHISHFFFPTGFLMMVTSHRIKMVCAERGVPVERGQGLGIEHLWRSFFGYMALALENLNRHILARSPAWYVINRTVDLLANELHIVDSLWRSHLRGFFAIVQLYGGVDTILKTSARLPYTAMNYCLVFTAVGNACSPVHDQIDGLYSWSEEDILSIYTHTFYFCFASPSILFLAVFRITRLRILVASGQSVDELQTTAETIAHSVHRFPTTDWTESYALPDDPLRSLLAAIFKVAAILYGLLSLPPDLARPFAGSYWDDAANDPVESARLHYRDMLLDMVWPTAKKVQLSRLSWIFAVLGVAYLDGPEDVQQRILQSLRAILRMEDVGGGAATMLKMFPLYWASGKLGWEQCYYKPCQVLC